MTPALSAEAKARRAARAALAKQAVDVVMLDVQGLSGVTDYFLVCSGRSTTHLQPVSEAVHADLKALGVCPAHVEGRASSGWIRIDYGDVLVHLFLEDTRSYYALERLWGDAPAVSVDGG